MAGNLVAHLVDVCVKGQDHEADQMHFHLERVKRELDIGFYSRNRPIGRDSSFSALG